MIDDLNKKAQRICYKLVAMWRKEDLQIPIITYAINGITLLFLSEKMTDDTKVENFVRFGQRDKHGNISTGPPTPIMED